MKKFLPLAVALFFLLTCSKNTIETSEPRSKLISVPVSKPNNSKEIKSKTEIRREVQGNTVIRTISAAELPLQVSETFTSAEQKLIIKITDYTKADISAKIIADGQLNIRINQIKLPDGSFDGPFSREMEHEVKSPGEVWLIIGHNLMAEGQMTGKFSVQID